MAGSVRQDSLSIFPEGSPAQGVFSRIGAQVVVDFYTYMALTGAAYQIRPGTITTPIAGDVAITDTAAEACVDVPSGTIIIPTYLNVAQRVATGTLNTIALKSVGAASTAGASTTVLPLKTVGARLASTPTASGCTARAATAGGVTVAAELITTTRRHYTWTQPLAAGAYPTTVEWKPLAPPILAGLWCLYLQVAATTTAPDYYAQIEWVEAPAASLL